MDEHAAIVEFSNREQVLLIDAIGMAVLTLTEHKDKLSFAADRIDELSALSTRLEILFRPSSEA